MFTVDYIGYFGCFLLTILSIPQVYLSYVTKSTTGLSLVSLCLGLLTSAVFITYGIMLEANPIIFSNIPPIIANSVLIYMKFKYNNTTMDESNIHYFVFRS